MTENRQLYQRDVSAPRLDLHSGVEYFDLLQNRIAMVREGGRIALMNMAFMPNEPVTQELFKLMGEAAVEKEASVTFGIDDFAMLDQRSVGPLVLPLLASRRRKVIQDQYAMLESLAAHPNARYGIINKLNHPSFRNLFFGRAHFKTDVIDDYFALGGVCLQDCHRIDMMVGMEHPETADWLYHTMTDITEAGSTREVLGSEDFIREIDDQTRILVDAGVPNQSLTLDEAIDLVDESEEWLVFACQFLPTGRIADHIVKAIDKDVEVHLAFNHPSKHDRLNYAHRFINFRERRRRPLQYFEHELPISLPPLHAKAIGNEKRAIVGGHNLLDRGVRYGTAEIALEQRSPAFARTVRQLLFKQIGYTDTPD